MSNRTYSIYVIPTNDQERMLQELMLYHTSAKVETYRLGYARTSVMEITFEDGSTILLNDQGNRISGTR